MAQNSQDRILRLKLEMSPDLLQPHLPSFFAKTVMPVDLHSSSVITVRNLMSFVFDQLKPMLRKETDTQKLYFTTKDGFFLPPNANVAAVISAEEPVCLLTWQEF